MARAFLCTLAVAAAVATAACGDDGAGEGGEDAGRVVDAGRATADPPAPAALPVLTPCPPGWREVADGEVTYCEPWPESGRSDCTGAEAHLPGTAGCAPIGRACPAGDYADDLPADAAIVYVRAGAPAGGDGTIDRPYAALGDGIARARARSAEIVALAKGTYEARVDVHASMRIQGACAAETVLTAPSAPSGVLMSAIAVLAPGVEIRDVYIRDPQNLGVLAADGGEVHLEGVAIEGAVGAGVGAIAARITANRLLVRGTHPASGQLGFGVTVEDGSTFEGASLAIEGNRYAGVYVEPGGSAIVADSVIRDTEGELSTRQFGAGVLSLGEAVELRTSVLEGNRFAAVALPGGSGNRIERCVLRDTREDTLENRLGSGLLVGADDGLADAEITATRIEGCVGSGLAITGGGSITVRDVSVVGTRPSTAFPNIAAGMGVSGAAFTGERIHLAENGGVGILIENAATFTISDLVTTDTSPNADELGGAGAVILGGATGALTRVRSERNHLYGVVAGMSGTVVEVSDATVADIAAPARQVLGRGIAVEGGGELVLSRARIERAVQVGLAAVGGTLTGTDVVVRDTLEEPCAAPPCPPSAGTGVAAADEARIVLTRFAVEDSPLCGVQVARSSHLELHEGRVARSGIAACVQVPGYDLALLMDDVQYVDNTQSVQATELPVPDPTTL